MPLKEQHLYEFGEFVLNTSERQLWRGEETVSIPPKAVETLCLLVENHGKLMSKDFLMEELWADTFVEDRNLAQNVFTLRKALGEDKNGKKFIETVPKRGYRFVAEVRPIEVIREELIELTLADETTITAEGNLSSKELAETVQKTAETLIGNQGRSNIKTKQLKSSKKIGFFREFSPLLKLSVVFVSLIAIGAAFWFGQNPENNSNKQSSSSNYEIAQVKLEHSTDSGKAWYPAISPDNKYSAYVFHENSKEAIHLQNLATGSITEVVPPTEAEINSPVFSKDGNYLFYPARDGGNEANVYKVPIFGGSKQKITTNVQSDIAISPDGKWLAFIRPSVEDPKQKFDLVISQTDAKEEKAISSREGNENFRIWGISPDWSPDGKKIISAAYTRSEDESRDRQNYFVEINVETGVEKKINAPDFYQVGQPRWMPDGKSILVLAKESANTGMQIWQITYPAGSARMITNDLLNYRCLSISPNGKFLLTNERKHLFNLSLIDSETGEMIEQLTDSTHIMNGYNGISWTPDGKQIVFSQTEGTSENIWLYDLDSKQEKQITFDKSKKNRHPHVTADGNSVIFNSDRSGNMQIWKISPDGSNAEQLTKGKPKHLPEISPDGRWLFYKSAEAIWKQTLDFSSPAVKFRESGDTSFVSNDSEQIIVNFYDLSEKEKSPWKFGLMPIEGNKNPEALNFFTYRTLSWKPDGSGIYYPNNAKSVNNIWFYSFSKNTSRQLTEFKDQRIVYLNVSPDGERIAVSRGSYKSEIIKISGF